jgi:flavin-dependent dehydrogenase
VSDGVKADQARASLMMQHAPARRVYDAIVVGARCAGAALATHLSRAGLSVVLLDAAKLPSDQPLSTHLLQPSALDALDQLGVGDEVRKLCPPLRTMRMEFEGRVLLVPHESGRAAYCLRREKLDTLLQAGACRAGADLRDESRVVGLLRSKNGRVCGVEVLRRGRGTEQLRAQIVVGADGRHSTVAKLVGATEYLGYDASRGGYWAYWPRPAAWNENELYTGFDRDDARIAFPADDGMLLIGTAPPIQRVRAWRGDRVTAYIADIRSFKPIGSYVEGLQPATKVFSLMKARYFFRVSAGPGWALAGDAGHNKDFVLALGISDALHDAKSLAAAIIEGSQRALAHYWRRRDVDRVGLFRLSQDLGEADSVTALERLICERVEGAPEIRQRFGAMLDGRVAAYDIFPASMVAQWVVAAALRGNGRPISSFIAGAWRIAQVRRELRYRHKLLARVDREYLFAEQLRSDAWAHRDERRDAHSSWLSRARRALAV